MSTSHALNAQITELVSRLNPQTQKPCFQELDQLIKQYGYEAYKYLLRSLIESIDLHGKIMNTPDAAFQLQADQTRVELLKHVLSVLMHQETSFIALGAEVFSSFQQNKAELIRLIARKLNLSIHEISSMALCLLQSQDQQVKIEGIQLIRDDILNAPPSVPNIDEVIQRLIFIIPKLSLFEHDRDILLKDLHKSIAARGFSHPLPSTPLPNQPLPGYSQHPAQHLGRPMSQPGPNAQLQSDMQLGKLFREFGYIATASEEVVREIFKIYKKDLGEANISSQSISCLLGEIISTHQGLNCSPDSLPLFLRQFGGANVLANAQDPGTWKLDSLVPVLKEYTQHLDWSSIIDGLDYPEFKLPDKKSLAQLIFLHEKVTGGAPFPIEKIIGRPWANMDAQLQFCLHGLSFPPSTLNFSSDKLHEINVGTSLKGQPAFHHAAWNSVEFIETLLNLAKDDKLDVVVKQFEKPIHDSPDILMIGVAQARPRHYLLQSEFIFSYLQPKISKPSILEDKSVLSVLSQILLVNPEVFTRTLGEIFARDASTLNNMVDILTELNVVELVFASADPKFGIFLAVTAAYKQKNILNFSLWLKSVLALHGKTYIDAFTKYLRVKLPQIDLNQKEDKELLDYIALFFRWVPLLPGINITELQRAISAGHLNPIPNQVWEEIMKLQSKNTFSVSKDIENSADSHLKDIFKGTITMERATSLLREFKDSSNTLDKKVYACMIHNLFDEYRFFPKYTDQDLLKAASLFGSIINHDIIKGKTLELAKNFIFSSWISQDPRMLQFAVIALNECRGRLKEWPHFCSFLKHSAGNLKLHYELASEIDNALKPSHTSKTKPIPVVDSNVNEASPSIYGIQKDASTLVLYDGEEIVTPSEEIQNSIGFIFNNLSQGKSEIFEEKVRSLKAAVSKEYYPYLCYYIVVERAATQLGHQDTYVQLILSMKDKEFEKRIMHQTYKSLNTLLKSPLKKENIHERKFLKTLGEWLGRLTLARNKPILVKELNFQELLIQSFEVGNLPAIAAFVSKTMSFCANSDAFKPPNPWTMMILSLLKEIHNHVDVDLSVRFDVEILAKALKLKLMDIPLREKPFLSSVKIGFSRSGEREFDISRLPEVQITLHGLSNDIFIPQLDVFTNNPEFKIYAIYALEQAIREIIGPIIKRSVGIACRTTVELVTKDFILDPDVNKFRRAAVQMATWLTSKWAHVTCKEHLYSAIYAHMKEYLDISAIQKDGIAHKIEQACKTFAEANTALGCIFIEESAKEKAEQTILEALAPEIEQRNKFIASGGRTPYTLTQENPYLHHISEALASEHGIQSYAMNVYDSFSSQNSVRTIPSGTDSHAGIPLTNQRIPSIPPSVHNQTPQVSSRLTFEDVAEMINKYLSNIMTHAQKLKQDTRLSSLAPDTEIIKHLTLIPKLLRQSEDVYKISTFLADNMIQYSYTQNRTQNPFLRDVYMYFLKASTQVSPEIIKQISSWWEKIEDVNQKYGDVSLRFLLENILDYVTVDKDLAHAIENNNAQAVMFAMELIREIQNTQKFKAEHFADTLEILHLNANQLPPPHEALVNDLYSRAAKVRSPMLEYESSIRNKEEFVSKFHEWMQIYENNSQINRMEQFVTESLQGLGLLTTDSDFVNLCKVLTKYSVDHFNKEYNTRLQQGVSIHDTAAVAYLFSYIDSYSKLVITIISMSNDDSKNDLMDKAINVTSRALFWDHEMNPDTFNQRAYQRIFSNFLILIHQLNDPPLFQYLLNTFSQKLLQMRPHMVPGFAFSWVDLLSHRFFMPMLLKQDGGYPRFFKLLTCLFNFMKPHLEKQKLTEPIKLLYRATLRILLVLLHDFSEFLCEYYFGLCDEIAPNCIQMRNLVLSAFPRHMRLPDPSTPNLKVDLLPEIQESPNISVNADADQKRKLKDRIDLHLKNRNQPLHDLIPELRLSTEQALETGKRYNIELINFLVLYIGVSTIETHNIHGGNDVPATDTFKKLIYELDAEGRYHVLNAIANQLRYPNSHTYYFSRVILDLFAYMKLPDDEELIQEQITRVIFERLIANRPHPWGLLVTFIELVRNSTYRIYDKQFLRCAPEITNIFNNVKPTVDKSTPTPQQ